MVGISGGAEAAGASHAFEGKERQVQHAEKIAETEKRETRRIFDDADDKLLISPDAVGSAVLSAKVAKVGDAKNALNNANRPFEPQDISDKGRGGKQKSVDKIDKEKPEKAKEGLNPLQLSGALIYRDEGLQDPNHKTVDPLQNIDASQTGYFESASGKIVNVASGRIVDVVS